MNLASEPEIAVTIRGGGWASADIDAGETAARLALRREGTGSGPAVASVLLDISLTDDAEQRTLNRTYRGADRPTNVLAFSGSDPGRVPPPGAPLVLGDVVLAWATIRREADEQGKPFADHLRHLVVHGVLHLLGYDHQDPAQAAAMEAREIAVLAELGVPNPYRDIM